MIDLREPANVDKAFVLAAVDDQPARLVIDLVRTDAASFQKNAIAPERAPTKTANAPQKQNATADTRPLIVIDPGHGGPDTGAVAKTGDEEKEVVLEVAKKLRDRLTKTGRYRVVMTRSDDTFVPLEERVAIARANAAALFISIHADSLSRGGGEVSGATIYTVSDRASDAEAQRLADKENRADLLAGYNLAKQPDDVANILFDLAHRETKNFSALFARTLAGSLKNAARLHRSPLRSAGFVVLKSPDVPSVLLELGYLSSPDRLEADDLRNLARQGHGFHGGGDRPVLRKPHRECGTLAPLRDILARSGRGTARKVPTDYFTPISNAVARLRPNTAEARRSIYDQARQLLLMKPSTAVRGWRSAS